MRAEYYELQDKVKIFLEGGEIEDILEGNLLGATFKYRAYEQKLIVQQGKPNQNEEVELASSETQSTCRRMPDLIALIDEEGISQLRELGRLVWISKYAGEKTLFEFYSPPQ